MPLSAEQQRERRAVKRAAEEAAGVFRRRRGRLAAGHVWDEQTGTAVPQATQPPTSPSAEEGESVPLTAGLAVPHYLLDRGEQARRPDHPAWLPFDPDTDDYDSDGSSGEEDSDGGCSKLERRAERFSNNWAAQQACCRREHLASMAKRAAAAVAWDQKHGARRDAELERVMAMRERDELDYFWVEVRPQSPAPSSPWKLREAKHLEADAVRTLGVNELNMYEPLLLYSGFAPFTGSLVEASAYFRGGQCDKDWLEDERERLFDALDAEMPPLPDPSPPPPLDLLAVHPLANYGSRAGDLQATDYDPWEPEQSELPTQTSSPPPPPPPAPAPAPAVDALSLGEAAHHALIAPFPLNAPTDGPRIMARLDPETYEPYYYAEDDIERQAARRLELLDTTVSNPGWMREQHDPLAQLTDSDARPVTPPDRTAFPRGEDGRKDFHNERANYYYDRTGEHLEGPPDAPRSLAEQHDLFHNLTRNFRTRNDL